MKTPTTSRASSWSPSPVAAPRSHRRRCATQPNCRSSPVSHRPPQKVMLLFLSSSQGRNEPSQTPVETRCRPRSYNLTSPEAILVSTEALDTCCSGLEIPSWQSIASLVGATEIAFVSFFIRFHLFHFPGPPPHPVCDFHSLLYASILDGSKRAVDHHYGCLIK